MEEKVVVVDEADQSRTAGHEVAAVLRGIEVVVDLPAAAEAWTTAAIATEEAEAGTEEAETGDIAAEAVVADVIDSVLARTIAQHRGRIRCRQMMHPR